MFPASNEPSRTSNAFAGPIGRVVRDRMIPLLFRYVVTEKSMAWMFEHHVDWPSIEPSHRAAPDG